MLPQDKLNLILRRRDEIAARLSAGPSGSEFGVLSRELSELEPLCETISAWRAAQDDEAGAHAMLADPATDAEMRELAEAAQLAHTTAALSSALRLTQRMAERPLPAHVRAALPDLSAAQRLVDAEAERLAAIAAALES